MGALEIFLLIAGGLFLIIMMIKKNHNISGAMNHFRTSTKPVLEKFGFELSSGTEGLNSIDTAYRWVNYTDKTEASGFLPTTQMKQLFDPDYYDDDQDVDVDVVSSPNKYYLYIDVLIANEGNRIRLSLNRMGPNPGGNEYPNNHDHILTVHAPITFCTDQNFSDLFFFMNNLVARNESSFSNSGKLLKQVLAYNYQSKNTICDLGLADLNNEQEKANWLKFRNQKKNMIYAND